LTVPRAALRARQSGFWRHPAFLLLLAVLLAALTHTFWLSGMGRFLVSAEVPSQADIVVVLAGDWRGNRVLKGGELVMSGFAPLALVSGPRQHYGLREYELAIPFAVRRGYPEHIFAGIPIEGSSTRAECIEIAAELRRRKVGKVLVVTSDYHTRRAGSLFRRAAPGIEVRMIAAPDTYFHPDDWWLRREGQKTFLLEWTKLVSTQFGM
jgi:uncharacterized SAM-binding protein YcdF (DUF218 family)